jgi:mycothiol synthase
MQATFSRQPPPPATPAGYRWVTYSAEDHRTFARGIMASYQASMDCPSLNGLRDIEDIMAGHKATGAFDPGLWLALCEGEAPAAVLLLSRVPRTDVLELVYLGLMPAYRGRGLGDLLMRRAVAAIHETGCARLSLAVDAQNMPALKLYWRHGMQAMGRKVAMIRDLRR